MSDQREQDFEKLLRSIPLEPTPKGLKERILGETQARLRSGAGITVFFIKGIACCLALSALCLFADLVLSRSENKRITALLNGQAYEQRYAPEDKILLAEALGASLASEMISAGNKKSRPGSNSADLMREILGGN
jgi:hypothetical protein